MHKYIVDKGGANHPNAKVKIQTWRCGQTMIKCANGETILITHDTNSPRRIRLVLGVQGDSGLWMDDDGNQIYVETYLPKQSVLQKESDEAYMKKYDHGIWGKILNLRLGVRFSRWWYGLFCFKEILLILSKQSYPSIGVYDARCLVYY